MSNADLLRQYKHTYGLNSKKVAILLGAKLKTVNSWLLSPDSPSYRPMPDYRLDHLKLKLRNRKKVECKGCIRAKEGMYPSHNGSKMCESGSIASGGDKSHCTCDVCF